MSDIERFLNHHQNKKTRGSERQQQQQASQPKEGQGQKWSRLLKLPTRDKKLQEEHLKNQNVCHSDSAIECGWRSASASSLPREYGNNSLNQAASRPRYSSLSTYPQNNHNNNNNNNSNNNNLQHSHHSHSQSSLDEQSPLPTGWRMMFNSDGLPYFVNETEKISTWVDPRTKKATFGSQSIMGKPLEDVELPEGWEACMSSNGVYYIDHVNKRTTWTDPRSIDFSKLNFGEDGVPGYDNIPDALQQLNFNSPGPHSSDNHNNNNNHHSHSHNHNNNNNSDHHPHHLKYIHGSSVNDSGVFSINSQMDLFSSDPMFNDPNFPDLANMGEDVVDILPTLPLDSAFDSWPEEAFTNTDPNSQLTYL